MPLLYLLEFLVAICLVFVVVGQIFIPIINCLPVFPFFRKTRKLLKDLSETNEELEDLKLKQQIRARKKLIEESKK